ncbi:hypothetical protein WJX81_004401 [Elliptochloris bilobata]|uniref:Protein HGH1 N-terminal domain-containing protein n=1 Tax=Elliptochloris bilobata TaxID=381761 RepID=A0AAW1SLM3_9CHLO
MAEGDGDQQELRELVDFLSDKRDNVRQMALSLVVGLTGSPEGMEKLSGAPDLLPALLRLVPDRDAEVSRNALTALVNISQGADAVSRLLELRAIHRLMDFLQEGACPHHDLLAMLLANLTAPQAGTDALLQVRDGSTAGLYLAVLLRRFLDSAGAQPDAFEHVALVLTNATRSRAARELLLEPGRGVAAALAAQLAGDRGLVRRRGCAAALRNLSFSAAADGTLERLVADAGVLTAMLEPLCGWEAPKEGDSVVRESLAEALMMLAETEAGRKALWGVRAPEMLKKGYELEEDAGVCLAMECMAQLFLQDGLQAEDGVPEAGRPELLGSAG